MPYPHLFLSLLLCYFLNLCQATASETTCSIVLHIKPSSVSKGRFFPFKVQHLFKELFSFTSYSQSAQFIKNWHKKKPLMIHWRTIETCKNTRYIHLYFLYSLSVHMWHISAELYAFIGADRQVALKQQFDHIMLLQQWLNRRWASCLSPLILVNITCSKMAPLRKTLHSDKCHGARTSDKHKQTEWRACNTRGWAQRGLILRKYKDREERWRDTFSCFGWIFKALSK